MEDNWMRTVDENIKIRDAINDLAKALHKTAVDHGWYDEAAHKVTLPESIALMHSELSEALEAYRHGDPPHYWVHGDGPGSPHPEGIAVELADCLIRILDASAYYGYDIGEAVVAKMRYNEGRPYRHGGKVC